MVIYLRIIDYAQIKMNLNKIERKTILVLKDNAYGFGFIRVLTMAIKEGFTFFAVAKKEDAIYILKRYKNIRVLLLGKEKLKGYENLYITVSDKNDLTYALHNKQNYHLKMKSLMNRLGVVDIKDYINNEYIKGIYLHIGSNKKKDVLKELESIKTNTVNINSLLIHVGGSICLEYHHDFINRIGFAIYNKSLKIVGKILKINQLKKGEFIGYDLSLKLKKTCLIGIVDVGYSSGLSRNNKNKYVYIKDHKYLLVGNKCMDYSFILIDEHVLEGDIVEFLGQNINLARLAKMEEKSMYELLVQTK